MGRRIVQAYSRTMTAAALIFLVIKVSLALTVLVTGMRAGPGDHLWLFRRPSLLARTLLAMNVTMPLIAVLIVSILRLDPAVKVALVALSISPVPPLLSKKVTKSRGASSYLVGLLFTYPVMLLTSQMSRWGAAGVVIAAGIGYSLLLTFVTVRFVFEDGERRWFQAVLASKLGQMFERRGATAEVVS